MTRGINSIGTLAGAAVALIVVAVSYSNGIGIEATILRGVVAGFAISFLFRLGGLGVVRVLSREPEPNASSSAPGASSQEVSEGEKVTKRRAA